MIIKQHLARNAVEKILLVFRKNSLCYDAYLANFWDEMKLPKLVEN